jgi:hypothetical protein
MLAQIGALDNVLNIAVPGLLQLESAVVGLYGVDTTIPTIY